MYFRFKFICSENCENVSLSENVKLCLTFRWMSVLERVTKLELPMEDDDADTTSLSTVSSLSSTLRPPQPKPRDDRTTSAPGWSIESDIQEDIYEIIK